MSGFSYHFAFFLLCTCVGIYFNRHHFKMIDRSIEGRYFPSWLIASVLSLLIGLGLWAIIEILLWKFPISF